MGGAEHENRPELRHDPTGVALAALVWPLADWRLVPVVARPDERPLRPGGIGSEGHQVHTTSGMPSSWRSTVSGVRRGNVMRTMQGVTLTLALALPLQGLPQGASDQQRERQLSREVTPCRIRQGHRDAPGDTNTAAGAMTLVRARRQSRPGAAPAPGDHMRSRSARAAKSMSTTNLSACCGGPKAGATTASAAERWRHSIGDAAGQPLLT
jgi:hypothetical protein